MFRVFIESFCRLILTLCVILRKNTSKLNLKSTETRLLNDCDEGPHAKGEEIKTYINLFAREASSILIKCKVNYQINLVII